MKEFETSLLLSCVCLLCVLGVCSSTPHIYPPSFSTLFLPQKPDAYGSSMDSPILGFQLGLAKREGGEWAQVSYSPQLPF